MTSKHISGCTQSAFLHNPLNALEYRLQADRVYVYLWIRLDRYYMSYYYVTNFVVIVTKMNMIDTMTCCYETLRTTVARIPKSVKSLLWSCVQRSQLLLKSSLVLATGPTCQVGSGSSSTRTRTAPTGLTTRKTQTVGNVAVLPPKTRHFKFTVLAPIKYLSSDRITTWSVGRLCSFSRSFTSRFQIWDLTSIRWVAIDNPPISLKISHYFTTTQWISVGLQIWMQEVKEGLKLNNLRIDYVMIRSKLTYLIGAKGVGTVYLEPRSGSNLAKYPRFDVLSG